MLLPRLDSQPGYEIVFQIEFGRPHQQGPSSPAAQIPQPPDTPSLVLLLTLAGHVFTARFVRLLVVQKAVARLAEPQLLTRAGAT